MKSKYTDRNKLALFFLVLTTVIGHLYIYSWLILFAFSDIHTNPIEGGVAIELIKDGWMFYLVSLFVLTSVQSVFAFMIKNSLPVVFILLFIFNFMIFSSEIYFNLK